MNVFRLLVAELQLEAVLIPSWWWITGFNIVGIWLFHPQNWGHWFWLDVFAQSLLFKLSHANFIVEQCSRPIISSLVVWNQKINSISEQPILQWIMMKSKELNWRGLFDADPGYVHGHTVLSWILAAEQCTSGCYASYSSVVAHIYTR